MTVHVKMARTCGKASEHACNGDSPYGLGSSRFSALLCSATGRLPGQVMQAEAPKIVSIEVIERQIVGRMFTGMSHDARIPSRSRLCLPLNSFIHAGLMPTE
jgi:hypothetical protein